MSNEPSSNDVKEARRTRRYVDGRQKFVLSYLGKPTRLPPKAGWVRPPFYSRTAEGRRKAVKTHKYIRKHNMLIRLRREGWIK